MELEIAYYAGGQAYFDGLGLIMPIPPMLVVATQPLGSPIDENTRTVHLPKGIEVGVRGYAPQEFCFLRAPINEDSRPTVKWIVRLVLGDSLWVSEVIASAEVLSAEIASAEVASDDDAASDR